MMILDCFVSFLYGLSPCVTTTCQTVNLFCFVFEIPLRFSPRNCFILRTLSDQAIKSKHNQKVVATLNLLPLLTWVLFQLFKDFFIYYFVYPWIFYFPLLLFSNVIYIKVPFFLLKSHRRFTSQV